MVSDDPEVLIQAVKAGSRTVQLRDKVADRSVLATKARVVLGLKDAFEFSFILNDDPELALELGADGVHIGQDTPTAPVRALIGKALTLGKTTHSPEQARLACQEGADYISAGPVHPTPTKPGRPAVGLDYVREVAAMGVSFVAIGGIDLSNVEEALEAGARVIGIVRAQDRLPELLAKVRARR